jgi:hypothetical protein
VITSLLQSLDSQVTLELFIYSKIVNTSQGSEYSLAVTEGTVIHPVDV